MSTKEKKTHVRKKKLTQKKNKRIVISSKATDATKEEGERMNAANENSQSIQMGETLETAEWRVIRRRFGIAIEELRGAGKRGARCTVIRLWSAVDIEDGLAADVVAVATSGASAQEMADAAKEAGKSWGASVEIDIARGVDIARSQSKVEINGNGVKVEFSDSSFAVEDLADEANRSTIISRGKRSAQRFAAWARANASALESMTLSQVMNAIESVGVDYHFYCAMD